MIWLREVNTSLIRKFKELTQNLEDYYNKPLNVNVIMRNPHTDLETETYPCISIYNLGVQDNLEFTDVNSEEYTYISEGRVEVSDKPVIHDFKYQVDIWCDSPLDRDAITGRLFQKLPKHSILEILDKDLIYTCDLRRGKINTLDFVNRNSETIYRNVVECIVRVPIVLDESKTYVQVGAINLIKQEV